MASSESAPVRIIDSHIHLYPESEVTSLAWYNPESTLAGQRSVDEFRTATGSPPNLDGFILVEADRKNDDSKDWTAPLQEIAWMRRIATGQPKPGEGHSAEDANLCLALIPWAPMSLGPEVLEKYLDAAEQEAGPAWAKVKGFRYLLQDKPNGTGLTNAFIDSLKLLGKRGYVFEIGVDQHRRGRIQLEEAVEMIDRAHEGVDEDEKVVFILNHLCKPDLAILNQTTDASFIAWRTAMFTLSKCRQTYMKLSGCLAEMPDKLKERPAWDIFVAISNWLAVVVAAFGPGRIMFGSDWPVCTQGVGDDAWKKWHTVVDKMCDMASLSQEDRAMLCSGTAKKAYKIEV
ncbi:L-rhamnono-gamma-lactonase [Madurella fahalii]|uniref:L-rhamnono-gamma-lactonase n=1 Tax=Madurella fahalii TaxID=1157608 RepID=A0ABQ0G854_9PEZI